jgi:hypothetical protein
MARAAFHGRTVWSRRASRRPPLGHDQGQDRLPRRQGRGASVARAQLRRAIGTIRMMIRGKRYVCFLPKLLDTPHTRPAQALLALRPAGSLSRPQATFVTRLQPVRLPAQAARQLPDQSTTLRVDSSSTDDSRLRGSLPLPDSYTAQSKATARSLRPVLDEPQPPRTEGTLLDQPVQFIARTGFRPRTMSSSPR